MKVRISSRLVDRILALAAGSENEICGLLMGTEGQVVDILPAANVARDPARRFEIDPVALFAAHRAARAGGPLVLGHYHSHPSGSPEPSVQDAAASLPDGALWMIVANGAATIWRAGRAGLHGRFVKCEPDSGMDT